MDKTAFREVLAAALQRGPDNSDRSRAEFVHAVRGGAILAGLEPKAGRGLCVVALGRQQIPEHEMREMLEGAAARLAARHASRSEIGLLEELLESCSAVEDDPDRLADANRLLHHAIYDASHNRYLLSALQSVYGSMALLGATTFTVPGRSRTANREHKAIVRAIAKRAPELAEQAARSHIERAKETRPKMLASSDPAPARPISGLAIDDGGRRT